MKPFRPKNRCSLSYLFTRTFMDILLQLPPPLPRQRPSEPTEPLKRKPTIGQTPSRRSDPVWPPAPPPRGSDVWGWTSPPPCASYSLSVAGRYSSRVGSSIRYAQSSSSMSSSTRRMGASASAQSQSVLLYSERTPRGNSAPRSAARSSAALHSGQESRDRGITARQAPQSSPLSDCSRAHASSAVGGGSPEPGAHAAASAAEV